MTLIIAEAGVNHNGNPKTAFELIDAAKRAGADVIKFQTFKAENLVTESAEKASYQITKDSNNESQLDMLKKLELPFSLYKDLINYSDKVGIKFLSTAFDSESLSFLVNDLNLQLLKIPSGELTNSPFILDHARTGRELIVSTGMASMAEIESALGVIAFGYTADIEKKPTLNEFQKAYVSAEGQEALRKNVTLLHCTSEYPAPFDSVHLNVINTLREAFGVQVGYSDHTEGTSISIAAVAKGAIVIEKHFTLDQDMEGPDHKASLEPDEFGYLVRGIRAVEDALGSSVKVPTLGEAGNKIAVRKSVVAAIDISPGDIFTSHNLAIKRPGSGLSPEEYWRLEGLSSKNHYKRGDLIIE